MPHEFAVPRRLPPLMALQDSLAKIERHVFLNEEAELNWAEIFCPYFDRTAIVDEEGQVDSVLLRQFLDSLVKIRTKIRNESSQILLDMSIERLALYGGIVGTTPVGAPRTTLGS